MIEVLIALMFFLFVMHVICTCVRVAWLVVMGRRSEIRVLDWPYVLLVLGCLVLGFGNLAGFSWSRGEFVPEGDIFDAAIAEAYPGYFHSGEDFAKEYPGFHVDFATGEKSDWEFDKGIWLSFLTGRTYQVLLPGGAIGIVDADGKARTTIGSRGCFSAFCANEPTATRDFGVVGVLVDGRNEQKGIPITAVHWLEKSPDDAQVSWQGSCLRLYGTDIAGKKLVVESDGYPPLEIETAYGFYRAVFRLHRLDDIAWKSSMSVDSPSLTRMLSTEFRGAQCTDDEQNGMRRPAPGY